jgi:Zn-dependent M28 family amino/carboxypeptidase
VEAWRPGESAAALALVAHHDTVPGSGGADDNGSGVAVLLEVARLLAPSRFRRSVVLAAVDLEETGRFPGADALIDRAAPGAPLAGAIVLESVGYVDRSPGSQRIPPGLGLLYPEQIRGARRLGLAGSWTLVIYRRSSEALARAALGALRATGGSDAAFAIRDPVDLPGVGRLLRWTVPTVRHLAWSDHAAFWRRGVPAICVTDTADLRNPHYHRPDDLPATLDPDRLAEVAVASAFAIGRLAGRIP